MDRRETSGRERTTEGKGNDIRQKGTRRQWSRNRLSPAFVPLYSFTCLIMVVLFSLRALSGGSALTDSRGVVDSWLNSGTWKQRRHTTQRGRFTSVTRTWRGGKKLGQDGTVRNRNMLQTRQMGTGGITEWTSGRSGQDRMEPNEQTTSR